MKVLVISHMYPSTYNEVHGIFVHQQVKTLKNKGIEVKVVSPKPWAPFPLNIISKKWGSYRNIPEYSIWEEVEVFYPKYVTLPKAFWLSSSGYRMYIMIQRVINSIYKKYEFDIIHAHAALPDGYAALLLAKKFRVPVVVTIHGQDLQQTIFRNELCKNKICKVISQCSKCILVSKKLESVASAYVKQNEKFTVIPNGIDLKDLKLNSSSKNFNSKSYILLSVSNLISSKGIDLNLKAVASLINKYPEIQYWVIGEGNNKKKLINLANELNISNNVKFLGKKPHSDVMYYMSKCNIFTLPSWKEGFGIVYLEAMANGKPVIGCQGEGIEDFVEHGKTGLLVKPHDIDSLAEALDYLLSNPEDAKSMGERAREVVLNNYTWEQNAEKTIEVYKEVLNNQLFNL